jgi:hypothetical protein
MRKNIVVMILLIFIYGCDGPGIAGAGRDSQQNLNEVENYKAYIAPQISEKVVPNECDSIQCWHSEDIFRSFSFSLPEVGAKPIEIYRYGLTVSFNHENREFVVQNKDKIIIKEKLPAVFYMHPLHMGIDDISGTKVLMVIDTSRATTGRRFIGLYTLDGAVLYRNVLSVCFAYDVNKTDKFIDIIGRNNSRRIVLNR